MSSIRRILASRANGALSPGPSSPEAKLRSSHNALRHGLLAKCMLLEGETKESFEALFHQHVDKFQPTDGVELGMIEEMCSAYWRLRRAWAIETRLLENKAAAQPSGDTLDRITAAFTDPATIPSLSLIHRYESRLHLMYSRALTNMLLLKAVAPEAAPTLDLPNDPGPRGTDDRISSSVSLDLPNDPSPISEHPESPSPRGADTPVCRVETHLDPPPSPPPCVVTGTDDHLTSSVNALEAPTPELPNDPSPISEHPRKVA